MVVYLLTVRVDMDNRGDRDDWVGGVLLQYRRKPVVENGALLGISNQPPALADRWHRIPPAGRPEHKCARGDRARRADSLHDDFSGRNHERPAW